MLGRIVRVSSRKVISAQLQQAYAGELNQIEKAGTWKVSFLECSKLSTLYFLHK